MLFLGNRILLEDGSSVIEPALAEQFLSKGVSPGALLVTELTPAITQFNKLSGQKLKLFTDEPAPAPSLEWKIPDAYKYLDVECYLFELAAKAIQPTDKLRAQREQRVAEELMLFEQHKMIPLLKTLIYIVDQLKSQNVVWGVGRGSSCSSYLLYLIGLHNVDPVKYEIKVTDFIRDD